MKNTHSQQALNQISLSLVFLGLIAGFLVGYGILIGDAQGRVNLLLLLILFAFLPVLGLLLSLLLLLTGGRKGLAGWVLELPVLPRHLAAELIKLGISGSRKSWLFYQTQLLTLSFACGGLLVYLLLLLGSDISFVWRSTLLEAADILPLLHVLAVPWGFWPEAQPSLDLLQQTQDFRLSSQSGAAPVLGQWWKYIFAAQCTYNLLPRTLMLLVSRNRYRRVSRADANLSKVKPASPEPATAVDEEPALAEVVYSIVAPYIVLDWASSPDFCHQQLGQHLGTPSAIRPIEPMPLAIAEENDSRSQSLVVLVKSWEPPLRELGDYLASVSGPQQKYILPMDWDERGVKPIRDIHLHEWRRFCASLEGWQLLQLEESS
ncbi:MAG: DUF2868 domain-containing protein [Pseudohongiella sp.]|nr:DUF2868 domain-containing protein [Pseudohongiella sp.]